MADYRPIPGQMDTGSMNMPTDDLSRMASERASNLLTPYGDQFGNGKNRPIVPPAPGATPAPGAANEVPPVTSPSTEDKLYQSIHPDTFSKVLETIMQFVTGKPIPKYQEGTDYVPKTGPAMLHEGERVVPAEENAPFRRGIPGEVVGGPSPMGGTSWKFAGGQGLGYESPMERGLRGTREVIDKISPYVGPAMSVPLKAFAKAGEVMAGGEGYPVPETGGSYAGPAPWRGNRPGTGGGAPVGGGRPSPEDWKDYSPEGQQTGIRYKMGPENIPGDEQARRGVLAEAGRAEEKYGIPIPRKSYYDVHPEERAAQEFYDRHRVSPDSYEAGVEKFRESNLMDIVQNPNTTKEARAAAGEQLKELQRSRAGREDLATKGAADIYGKALEYGPTSPGTQERLAKAQYERAEAAAKMANIPFDQYLKTAQAKKDLGEAAKTDYISGKWGVYHVPTGTFSAPPEGQDKTSLTMIQNLEKEASALSGGDTNLSRRILRDKVKTYIDMGLLKKQDIPSQFFKMTILEFADALKKAGKVPKNREELNLAYGNYVKIPIEG